MAQKYAFINSLLTVYGHVFNYVNFAIVSNQYPLFHDVLTIKIHPDDQPHSGFNVLRDDVTNFWCQRTRYSARTIWMVIYYSLSDEASAVQMVKKVTNIYTREAVSRWEFGQVTA